MENQLSGELIELAQYDLRVRERLSGEGKLSEGYNAEMEAVHRRNAAKLRKIVGRIGWPTVSKVGKEASDAAWLIVQHAIGEPEFMKSCYTLMVAAHADINPQNLAYLHDRICYFEGRPQRYGTQFADGLYPVENKEILNGLRRELGMAEHPERIIIEAGLSDTAADLHQGNEPFNQWRKKVGWIS